MKPYQQIPIADCGDRLVPIPADAVAFVDPHPYVQLGAPYGDKSPYFLRQGVLDRLLKAQTELQQVHPGWQIQIFDAYRPVAVQQFMVNHAYAEVKQEKGLGDRPLTPDQQEALLQEVYQFWAAPSNNPATPPPHSTGAALDVTLVDEQGQSVDMGSPIDELSLRSYPDYFAPQSPLRPVTDQTPESECDRAHAHRQLLLQVMSAAGFQRHPNEWWHFSYGDQYWVWLMQQQGHEQTYAYYGMSESF